MTKSIEVLKSELKALSLQISQYERESGKSFANHSFYPEEIREALKARSQLAAQIRAA